MNYNELELINATPDDDCLKLANEFADIQAWRELHHEVLKDYGVGQALLDRFRNEVKTCTAKRLEGALFLWQPLVNGNDEFLGLVLIVCYETEPRIAQNPACLEDFLGVIFDFGCVTQLVVSVSQFRYALVCSHEGGEWQRITHAN